MVVEDQLETFKLFFIKMQKPWRSSFNVIVILVLYRYDEVCKPGYNFASGGFSSGTGHFTQVVWKDSVKLGIGQGKATQNGMQCIYVVGRYDIAGNMMGEFQDKVLRGNFDQGYCNNLKK